MYVITNALTCLLFLNISIWLLFFLSAAYITQFKFEHGSPLRQLLRWSWHILIILFWNGFSFICCSSSLTPKCLNHPHYFNAALWSSISHIGFVGKLVYTKQCVYCKESLCKYCNTYWIKGTVMYSLRKEILDEIQFYRICLLRLWMINICLEAACVSMYSDLVVYVFEGSERNTCLKQG